MAFTPELVETIVARNELIAVIQVLHKIGDAIAGKRDTLG